MKKKLILVTGLHLLSITYVFSQRLFTVQIDSLTRSYFVNAPKQEAGNLPMIVILHDNNIMPTLLGNLPWNKLQQPAVMVFPVGLINQWHCKKNSDSLLTERDQKFLLRLVFHVQNNFKTDLSRTFLIGMGDAFCAVQDFVKKHPTIVRSAVRWDYKKELLEAKEIIPEPGWKLDSLVRHNPPKGNYLQNKKFPFEQEEKIYKPYRRHLSFGFNLGRWQQAMGSRTEFDTVTFVDISERHFIFGVQVEYNITERISAFTDVNFMIIPKEESINSISIGPNGVQASGSGHGGIVIPYGAGIRYVFLCKDFRPFITVAFGHTYLHTEGGTGSGSLLGGTTQETTKKTENIFTYRLGVGFDYRLSEDVSFRSSASYFMSNNINPAVGSIDTFQGLSILAGLNFIFGK